MGDECVYATAQNTQQLTRHVQSRLYSPQPAIASSTGFGMQDLRFFHSFITCCYPTFPFESEQAWTHDIPLIAQQFPFLNDAILALGATHIYSTTTLDVEQTVHKYRISAIRGINSEENFNLCNPNDPAKVDRATAVLASCVALAFASLHMGDPLGQFLVLSRGAAGVTRRMVDAGITSPLFLKQEEEPVDPHLEAIRRRTGGELPIPLEQSAAARESLSLAERSCTFEPVEQLMLDRMQSVVAITSGPIEAFHHYNMLWTTIIEMDSDDFAHFTNGPTSLSSKVLQTHFLAFEIVVRPWIADLQADKAFRGGGSKLLRNILDEFPCENGDVDAALSLELINWPRQVLEGIPWPSVPGVTRKNSMNGYLQSEGSGDGGSQWLR